jgi:hypothetical protein
MREKMKSIVRMTAACTSNSTKPTKAISAPTSPAMIEAASRLRILLTKIGKLLALEPLETVVKFGDEIGLAVLSGGELQPAEKLRGLMHQLNAQAA